VLLDSALPRLLLGRIALASEGFTLRCGLRSRFDFGGDLDDFFLIVDE